MHRQQIPHLQIRVVPQQRRKLREQRRGKIHRKRKGQRQRQDIGGVEIPVVHMRQQERDTDREQHRRGEHRLIAQPSAPDKAHAEHREHIRERPDDAGLGGGVRVGDVADQRKHRGRIIIQPRADAAGLAEIQQ